ncbi:winged helix-turn-helix domain-containing protein [Stenotrophomonas sp. C3(2023)]|uniref:winged helix-turn-helix domain-containing protein n=1 Tax=Stenotrophomonas sp. C3(2023) TaxID=3080277 RepID=UPI00293C3A56|nr:winged helix-turn-helix domain-containing protein [Stenotrophomonas sp. C3(2023)]MDV3467674.1 winged helix-turn-helix domain-containing protein [Stenotrophomonas sp. C3(2023)]
MPKLLLVEDDVRLAQMISRYLLAHHFTIVCASDGAQALQRLAESTPDVVLLDLQLPDMDGMDLCREMRSRYEGLLLIFSARGDDISHVLGLELGADDYIPKPVEPRVLLARLRAHLRRRQSPATASTTIAFGTLRINPEGRMVELDDQPVQLTTAEFDLLLMLARNAGQVVNREQLFKALRGIDFDGMDRSIDARVSRLRRKLGDNEQEPLRIRTVRGRGYLFSPGTWQ